MTGEGNAQYPREVIYIFISSISLGHSIGVEDDRRMRIIQSNLCNVNMIDCKENVIVQTDFLMEEF